MSILKSTNTGSSALCNLGYVIKKIPNNLKSCYEYLFDYKGINIHIHSTPKTDYNRRQNIPDYWFCNIHIDNGKPHFISTVDELAAYMEYEKMLKDFIAFQRPTIVSYKDCLKNKIIKNRAKQEILKMMR